MIHKLFHKYKGLIRELFLYGVIGSFSALMDTLSFMILSISILPTIVANFISVNIGITISFFMNTYINFRKSNELKKRAIKFWSVGYTGLLLSTIIVWIGVDILQYNRLGVKMLSVIIAALIQYLLNKFITFKN